MSSTLGIAGELVAAHAQQQGRRDWWISIQGEGDLIVSGQRLQYGRGIELRLLADDPPDRLRG